MTTLNKIKPYVLQSVLSALDAGVPKLRLMNDTPYEIILRAAKTGEIIDDADCKMMYEALKCGIYLRTPVVQNNGRWMFLCNREDLHEFLLHHTCNAKDVEIDGMAIEAVMQTIQHENSRKRLKR